MTIALDEERYLEKDTMGNISITALPCGFLLVSFSLLLQSRARDDILGKWESESIAQGLGNIFEFGHGESLTYTVVTGFHGTYELRDGYLITKTLQPGGKEDIETNRIKIEADHLILVDVQEIRFTRSSPSTLNSPIAVGKWSAKGHFLHHIGDCLWELELNPDGQYRSRIQAPPEKGVYKTEGNLLTITLEGSKKPWVISFRVENGFLVLKYPPDEGGEQRYKRIEL